MPNKKRNKDRCLFTHRERTTNLLKKINLKKKKNSTRIKGKLERIYHHGVTIDDSCSVHLKCHEP